MFKRTFSVILIAILAAMTVMPAFAAPETVDLAAMSLKDLQALVQRVLAAMWASGDWQEVQVPAGAYKVGAEIPAGKWTIRPTKGHYAEIWVSTEINEAGTDAAGKYLAYEAICDKDSFMYGSFPNESFTVDIKAGQYIIIEDAPVIFTPYSGPSFTFK